MSTHIEQSLTYSWKLNAQEDLNTLAYVEIIYWNVGMSIIGFSDQKTVVNVKHYEWSAQMELEQISDIILDETLLGGQEHVTKIWIASDRNMLVPKQLFDIKEIQNWFQKLYFVEANESIEISATTQPNGYSIDAIRKDLLDEILHHTHDTQIDSLFQCLLANTDATQNNIAITLMGNYAVMQAYQEQQLQLIQLTNASAANILHLIHTYGEQQQVAQDAIKILIQGYSEAMPEIKELLGSYFQVQEGNTNEAFFNFIGSCEL